MTGSFDWDYLIVGQGLAGSLLAWELQRRGRRVLVLDDGHRSAASTAAAGLVNPLAGLRFSRPAGVGDWLAAGERLYAGLGRHFGRTYFHPLPMVRLFRSAEQVRFWERRHADPAAAALLGPRFGAAASGQPVAAPYGGFHQRATGYLDIPGLLADLCAEWRRGQCCRTVGIAYADIAARDAGVSWQGLRARTLVFCEGHRGSANPWFGWLPYQPDRGEILTFASDEPMPDRIVNAAHWLLPLVDGRFRVGATHDHHDLDAGVTGRGRAAILDGLAQMLGRQPRVAVQEHLAGVRPGTLDRAPLLGRHPEFGALAVFNGFGAKGSLMIPWYAGRFADHLESGAALPAEADIARCA